MTIDFLSVLFTEVDLVKTRAELHLQVFPNVCDRLVAKRSPRSSDRASRVSGCDLDRTNLVLTFVKVCIQPQHNYRSMQPKFQPLTSQLPTIQPQSAATGVTERVLCVHCQRTATNGNQCQWICKREQMELAADRAAR